MSDNNSGGELGAFLAGFVIGGLVGAATALILAPQSGSDTRNQIVNKSNQLVHSGEERISGYATNLQEGVQAAGDQVADQTRIVLDAGKDQVSRLRSNSEEMITDLDETVEGDAPATE